MWDEEDGFYYDRLRILGGDSKLLRIRSLVGLIPLFATDTLEFEQVAKHPGFQRRMQWFVDNRPDLTEGLAPMLEGACSAASCFRWSRVNASKRILQRLLDTEEFLSPYGVRSVSRYHKDHPYTLTLNGQELRIDYEPAESQTTHVRRELELARAGLVSDELPHHRSFAAAGLLLRRFFHDGVSVPVR